MPLYTSSSSVRCGIPDMISIRSSLDQLAELGLPSGTTLSQLNPQLSLPDDFRWINQLTEMILAVCSPGRVAHLDLLLRAAANHPNVHQFPAVHEAAILGVKSLRAWIQRESTKSRVINLSSHWSYQTISTHSFCTCDKSSRCCYLDVEELFWSFVGFLMQML